MRARQNDQRLLDREAQTRSWAAPLPDFSSMPRYSETPRMRVEWDTRDTMNNRLWSDMQVTGPKAVTSEMLAAHPTGGAQQGLPTAARQDQRSYISGPTYFPDAPPIKPGEYVQERPKLPPRSLFQNAWTTDMDIEGSTINVARELQGVVKEENRHWHEDAGTRVMQRMFQHQWVPAQTSQALLESQLAAAERLRPAQDDYRVQMNR
jgi:hypothetical protein